MEVKIEKVENGYILKFQSLSYVTVTEIYPDVQSLFTKLLYILEGRSENLGGRFYGKVDLSLEKEEE